MSKTIQDIFLRYSNNFVTALLCRLGLREALTPLQFKAVPGGANSNTKRKGGGRVDNLTKAVRKRAFALIAGLGILIVSGCGGGQPASPPASGSGEQTSAPQATATSQPSGPVIAWDKTPGTIVVRLDRLVDKEPDYQRLNRIPPCTLYGDGRLVWVNNVPPSGEEVLEAYLDDVAVRGFIEFIIREKRFYDVPDYAAQELPPTETAAMDSITLNLTGQQRTIRSYRPWPENMYFSILETCGRLSNTPAQFLPVWAWASAYSVPSAAAASRIGWPPTGQFKMAELAASGDRVWISGPTLRQLWNIQRASFGTVLWIEGDKTYQVALQVPGVSRDAPPPPPGAEQTPTPQD